MKNHKEQSPKKHVIIISMITALALIGDSMLYIALPVFWREAGLDSIWQVGVILSINRFVRIPLHPMIGYLYQKISIKTGLTIAVILGVITTCGYGLAQDFTTWIILRCLWGLSWSLFRIGGLSSVVILSDDLNRGKLMGMYNGLYRLGSLFGMLLGGIFVSILGFSAISMIFGVISAIGLPMILTAKIDRDKQSLVTKNKTLHVPIRQLLKLRLTILVLISGLFVSLMFQGIFASILSAVIEYHYGMEMTILGLAVTVTALSGFIQAARWMWEPFLAKSFGSWSDQLTDRTPLYIGSLLFSGVTFGFMLFNLPILLWVFIVMLVMLAATALTTITDALAGDVAQSSSVVSFMTIYSILQDFGAATGPLVAYLLITGTYGYHYIFIGGSILFVLMSLLWLGQWRANKRLEHISQSQESI